MPRGKYLIFHLMLLLSGAITAVVCDDLFGMRLTTETLKTKEKTHYRFHYFVKDDSTGDYKTQEEIKEGDSVHGSYTLAEPNGDLRTVTYTAGPGKGFEAKVDIHPSASPMKPTTEQTTPSTATLVSDVKTLNGTKRETATTPEPNDEDTARGIIMDILRKPQSDGQTEMATKFSLNTDFATEPGTNAAAIALEGKTTETTETTPEATRTTFTVPPLENLERSTSEITRETTSTTEDPIQKELDDAENSMPKLPEVIFPDNKTHFKFYKDPEEAFLDERITQIARQLAETSLRREYEERKLGHFIPISVTSVEPSTSSHLSKSFKFTRDGTINFRPFQQPPPQVLTQVKLIPQYVYKDAVLPRFLPANQRLPVIQTTIPIQSNEQWDQQTYEAVTNVPEILKINKSKPQLEEINKILRVKGSKYSTNYDATEREPVSVSMVPIQAPTFLQFFSPYVVPTQGNYVTQTKRGPELSVTPANEDLSKAYAPVTAGNEQNITKS